MGDRHYVADLRDTANELIAAQLASERASAARLNLPSGSSRARVTSANAKWARAAEDRERKATTYRELIAAEAKRLGLIAAPRVPRFAACQTPGCGDEDLNDLDQKTGLCGMCSRTAVQP